MGHQMHNYTTVDFRSNDSAYNKNPATFLFVPMELFLLLQKETNYKKRSQNVQHPPTAQTTGAIESIFWLEVHQADTNGATVAISEFPSQTGDIDHLLISAKVLILAIWSSFFWVLEGNSKIATVAPFIFTLCISSPKISPIAPTILAVGGGVLYVSGAPHLVIRLFLYI